MFVVFYKKISLLCCLATFCMGQGYHHAASYGSLFREAQPVQYHRITQPYHQSLSHHVPTAQYETGEHYNSLSNSLSTIHHDLHQPKYVFKYGVKDVHTGDTKYQEEQGDNGVVKGYYMLHEPDGTIRIVHYTADKHNGFRATVQRIGPHHSVTQKFGYD